MPQLVQRADRHSSSTPLSSLEASALVLCVDTARHRRFDTEVFPKTCQSLRTLPAGGGTFWKRNAVKSTNDSAYRLKQSNSLVLLFFLTSGEDFGDGLCQGWLFCYHEHGLHSCSRLSGPQTAAPHPRQQQEKSSEMPPLQLHTLTPEGKTRQHIISPPVLRDRSEEGRRRYKLEAGVKCGGTLSPRQQGPNGTHQHLLREGETFSSSV